MYIGVVAVGHGRPWVIDNIKCLSETSDPVGMMLLCQHQADGFASGKDVQQLAPEKDIMSAKLSDLVISSCNKFLLAVGHVTVATATQGDLRCGCGNLLLFSVAQSRVFIVFRQLVEKASPCRSQLFSRRRQQTADVHVDLSRFSQPA